MHTAEALARSLREGRTVKAVTQDPATSKCANDLTRALQQIGASTGGSRDAGGEPPQLPMPAVLQMSRAVGAFSRMRILHTPLLATLSELHVDTWRELPASSFASVLTAFAWLQAADEPLLRRWAVALDEATISNFSAQDLASVVWASATFQMGAFHGLHGRLVAAFEALDARRVHIQQLSKLACGLAKMEPGSASEKTPAWGRQFLRALPSKKVAGGALADALWTCGRLGQETAARQLFDRAPAGQALGRDAYAVLLRDAEGDFEGQLLQHLADAASSPGLRAAVLNAAAIRRMASDEAAKARAILNQMAMEGIWTPVTYRLASRLEALEDAAGGEVGSRLEGRPQAPGMLDPGRGSHKYVRAVYHALERSTPGDARSVLKGLEHFSRTKGWLKFGAADEKGGVIDEAVRRVAESSTADGVTVVEFGTFLGYSAIRMALELGPGARIVTFEVDPEVACLAMNIIEFSGVDADIQVWVGHCEDLAPRLLERLGPRSVSLVYMDHNQMIYHEDTARLEQLGVLRDGALLVATQGLKPGAPLLFWRLAEAARADRCWLEIISAPDCGCPNMEEWVVLAELRAFDTTDDAWEPRAPPKELLNLAAECNLMRWRTAQGLVDETRWNQFVQHVRRGLEKHASVECTREAWPDAAVLERARKLQYEPLDY